MRRTRLFATAVGLPMVALPILAAAPALAAPSGSSATTLHASLQPVPENMATASGAATVTVNGDTLDVTIRANGLDNTSANGLPAHAQHIHIGGSHTCPTASAATDHNGHQAISTKDAASNYGPIQVSLTESGDTSPDSALALKRFPTTPKGTETYHRSIQVSPSIAQQVANGQGVVVIHGIDYLHNGTYTDLGKSELDPSLPLEGTAPALCGALVAMPTGAAATGGGSSSGIQDEGLLAAGAAAIAAAGGALAYRRRRTNADS